ncbi:hypothetical protein ACQEU8_04275 [Streptomyces sp. CA-250714]|uniref:hypothetical protein n=1 Tax=Streptomyces sp. CA-250714 TaxID=3240060 RepID=UPI003D8E35F9
MSKDDVALILTAVSALSSVIIAIGTITSVWIAREATRQRSKQRGKRRRWNRTRERKD